MTMTVANWLASARGLDAALTEEMGVKEVSHPNLPGPVVAFPYRRNGENYAAKFRTVEGKDWRSTQGVTRGLFNADCLSQDGPAVITEGEIDCLSVIQAGFSKAVSLPDGWSENGASRDCLVEAAEALKSATYVVVAGDNDAAGRGLPKAVANILLGHDVRSVDWPKGCKDANDVLVRFGEGELSRCIVDARPIDPAGGFITGLSDLPPLPDRKVLRSGVPVLDYVLAFEVGGMSVATGMPGCGKSTLTTFVAHHIAKHEQVRVGLLPFETHPFKVRDHLARLETAKPWAELSFDQQARLAVDLDKRFRIVHRTYDEGSHALGWLKDMIYTLAVRDGCKLIIVDPWNEVEHLPEPGESMTSYINFALKQIRMWAEQFDTHICVVAHPRKMNTDGKPRLPVGYDVADSAAFSNKPSLGFTVHPEEDEDGTPFVRLATWKVRDTQFYGFEKGSVRLRFDPHAMTYSKFESMANYGKAR